MEYYNEDYLMHHGIKGMKWGVRRYQNKDGTLTPKGKKHYRENGDDENKSPNRTLSEKQKKTLKVGVAVAGGVLAAYGAYKLNKYVKGQNARLRMFQGAEFAKNFTESAGKHAADRLDSVSTRDIINMGNSRKGIELKMFDYKTGRDIGDMYTKALANETKNTNLAKSKGAELGRKWFRDFYDGDKGLSRVHNYGLEKQALRDYHDIHAKDSFVTAAKNVYQNRKKYPM